MKERPEMRDPIRGLVEKLGVPKDKTQDIIGALRVAFGNREQNLIDYLNSKINAE